MFADDIKLVREMVGKYGLMLPFVDLGGLKAKDLTVADYALTLQTGDQHARYVHLTEDPFADIAPGYEIINPQYGQPFIEQLPRKHAGQFGTIVCLSVLEHVRNPFEVFSAFYKLLKPGGLLICSTVLVFPIHDEVDNWRYTPECLKRLARLAGCEVLEYGKRLDIDGAAGILDIKSGRPQEIISTFVVARKP